MVRELITVQVGQCGNQIAMRFWDLALKQHSNNCKNNKYDDALSAFFKNVGKYGRLPLGSKLQQLKARALVVDMQEGVINQMIKSDLGSLFDYHKFIKDVSGAGNNWAHGHFEFGQKYKTQFEERIKSLTEQCDSLQAFFMMHSLGGGTGSGVGTFLLGVLQDHFPQVFRFTASVFPSNQQDDVVTSPYNSLFSLNQLLQHADCVLPIDNQALLNILETVDKAKKDQSKNKIVQQKQRKKNAYDRMNGLIAHLLSNLTCSMRFEGILNVDFNEITMNLVPYPDLKFLVSSLAPLYSILDSKLQPRRFDQIFDDILDPGCQLLESNPLKHKYLCMGMILRGNVSFSDVNSNIKRLRQTKKLNMIHWNTQGFKYGICNTPPVGQPYSILCLANNTCVSQKFNRMVNNFNRLYKKKVYVCHYEKYMQVDHFDYALNNIQDLIARYQGIQNSIPPPQTKRLKPLII